MQATCGGYHQIFAYASTAGTLQKGSHAGTEMDLSAFMYHEGIVSGIALGLGGADFQSKNVSGSAPRFFAQLTTQMN